jgi:hypothetical protein
MIASLSYQKLKIYMTLFIDFQENAHFWSHLVKWPYLNKNPRKILYEIRSKNQQSESLWKFVLTLTLTLACRVKFRKCPFIVTFSKMRKIFNKTSFWYHDNLFFILIKTHLFRNLNFKYFNF